MAYIQGNTILDDEYNLFVAGSGTGTANDNAINVNTVWGVGYGRRGFGQGNTLLSVSPGTVITATQWASLVARINNIASQQGNPIGAMVSPTVTELIDIISNMSANVSDVYHNAISLDYLTDITTFAESANSIPWSQYSEHMFTVKFLSSNHARYFFNAGGRLEFVFSQDGGTASAKNLEWRETCETASTISVSANKTFFSPGGVAVIDGGYYGISTTGYTTLLRQDADLSPYDANYLILEGTSTRDVSDTNGGNGKEIQFKATFFDEVAETYPGQQLDGKYAVTLTVRYPATTYITDTWGIPNITTLVNAV